jgi:Tfp pilus assembly protein PilF
VTDEDFRKAAEYYQRAIEIDPQSALASDLLISVKSG